MRKWMVAGCFLQRTALPLLALLLLLEASTISSLTQRPRTSAIKHAIDRRTLLTIPFGFGTSCVLSRPSPCRALGEGEQRMKFQEKPRAPVAALVPAIQQRLLIEACISKLSTLNGNNQEQSLESIMSVIVKPSDIASDRKNRDKSIMKQYQTRNKLSGALVRAAMNIYTANLSYDNLDQFQVTDAQWKKSYIREYGGLPNLKQVIQADLNIRDLYCNKVQLNLDDAAAELYSLQEGDSLGDLRDLLTEAANSFDLWLEMVDDKDLAAALQLVAEGKDVKVLDSYFAGFVPNK